MEPYVVPHGVWNRIKPRDVLVEAEQVLRIVLGFYAGQAAHWLGAAHRRHNARDGGLFLA